MVTIVTICGTSFLTNTARENGFNLALVTRNANVKTENEVPIEERKQICELLRSLDTSLKFTSYSRLSAEINSLVAYYKSTNGTFKSDRHILIATDTWLGKITAQKLEDILKIAGVDKVSVETILGLRTNDSKEFREGCSQLLTTLYNLNNEASSKQGSLVLNLTGGFKAVLMTLQSFAMMYSIPSFNLFESNSELLWLPQLPFKFDTREFVSNHLKEFRLLNINLFKEQIPSTLEFAILSTNDDQHMLSEWGELLWAVEQPNLYRTKLYEPPVDFIKFAPGFQEQAEEFARTSNKLEELNKKIDTIVKLIASHSSGESFNLEGTTIKQIKGKATKAPDISTHEIYASNDDATRIYCHKDGPHWVLDRLDKHL